MNYLDFDLGALSGGESVTVILRGVESDVMLMTASDVQRFASGNQVTYWGGHYRSSPAVVHVPNAGTWHVLVIPGLGGRVEAEVGVSASRRVAGF
jgi:Domain of unknown function (DUF1883)